MIIIALYFELTLKRRPEFYTIYINITIFHIYTTNDVKRLIYYCLDHLRAEVFCL